MPRLHPSALLAILSAITAPALAFDDGQFCVAVQQIAIAAEKDIGVWIDRTTRNAGISVACDTKVVQFTRFSYSAEASMTAHWKARRSAEWSAAQCKSALWREAIGNGWTVA